MIEGYVAPNNDLSFEKVKTFWSKDKKENFMEVQAKRRKDLPAPNKYEFKTQWSG